MPEKFNQTRTKVKNFFSNLSKKYSSLFQEGIPEAWSMMRYLTWFIVTDIMTVWTYLSVKKDTILEIPYEVAAILVAALGGKLLQKSREKGVSPAVGEAPVEPQPLNEETKKEE